MWPLMVKMNSTENAEMETGADFARNEFITQEISKRKLFVNGMTRITPSVSKAMRRFVQSLAKVSAHPVSIFHLFRECHIQKLYNE